MNRVIGFRILVATVVVSLPMVGVGMAQAQADSVSMKIVATDKGVLSANWKDYDYPLGTRQYNAGNKTVDWKMYRLADEDTKYNYYLVKATVRNNTTHRQKAPEGRPALMVNSPAQVRIGVHGKGLTVKDLSYTGSKTLDKHCIGTVNVGMSGSLGPFSAGFTSNPYQVCGGGTKVTAAKQNGLGEVLWKLDRFENLTSGTFTLAVKTGAKYRPDFKIDVLTPDDYVKNKKGVDRWRYQHVSTGTYCRIGSSKC